MVCSFCGAEVSDQRSTFCGRCGRPLGIAPPATPSASISPSNALHGVQGGLLLLCIALTVGIPLLTAYNWSKVFSYGPTPFPWFSLGVSIVMALFSFFAGLSLWTVRPNAVRIAKAYFITEMIIPFVFGARLVIEVATSRVEMSAWSVFAVFIRPILIAVVGYLYLTRSKRVQATYGKTLSASV